MPVPGEDGNALDNFEPYEDKESTLEAQNIERDHKDLIGKSSNTGNCAKTSRTLQDELLKSELSSFLREVKFSKEEFFAGILVFNIKYDHPRSQKYNLFYPFYNQLDYALAHYFAKSETTKGNIDKFLSDPLIALFTEKLSYKILINR